LKQLVVDASVAVKWFVPEIHHEAAGKILKSKWELLAPDIIWAEVGNSLWKKKRRDEISAQEAVGILKDFKRFPIQTYGSKLLLDSAWYLAQEFGVSVYDGMYLALAISRDCSLVTADRKFFDLFQKESIAFRFLWVEDAK